MAVFSLSTTSFSRVVKKRSHLFSHAPSFVLLEISAWTNSACLAEMPICTSPPDTIPGLTQTATVKDIITTKMGKGFQLTMGALTINMRKMEDAHGLQLPMALSKGMVANIRSISIMKPQYRETVATRAMDISTVSLARLLSARMVCLELGWVATQGTFRCGEVGASLAKACPLRAIKMTSLSTEEKDF